MSDSVSSSDSSHESHKSHESNHTESKEEHQAHDSADKAKESKNKAEASAGEAKEKADHGDTAGAQAAADNAQHEADTAKEEAGKAQQAADAAQAKADRSGAPADQVSASYAQQAADEARASAEAAQKAADAAQAAVNNSSPGVAEHNGQSAFIEGTGQAHVLDAPPGAGQFPADAGLSPGDPVVVSTGSGLNLRAEPNASSASQGVLPPGTSLTITEPPPGQAPRPGWVPVTTSEGKQGWVSEKFVSKLGQGQQAPVDPAAPATLPPGPNGTQQSFVSANYVDLGRPNESGQIPDPVTDEANFRLAVQQDLDRLQGAGVNNVRIWADEFKENNLGETCLDNPAVAERLTKRVQIIAEEAEKRNMTVTVDLFDGNAVPKDVNGYRTIKPGDAELNARIDTIVKGNAGATNIIWSVGNEIGDPANPQGFVDWYKEKVDRIHAAVKKDENDPTRAKIQLEVTPGALGHPYNEKGELTNPAALNAMREVARVSDVVSVHFYAPGWPPGTPGMPVETQLPFQQHSTTGAAQGIFPQLDYTSLKAWNDVAKGVGYVPTAEHPEPWTPKPLTLGEFAVPRDTQYTQNLSPEQYRDMNAAWLQRLQDDGIDLKQVSFWQFAKDDPGQFDEASSDIFRHLDSTKALAEWLVQQGMLKKLPWNELPR